MNLQYYYFADTILFMMHRCYRTEEQPKHVKFGRLENMYTTLYYIAGKFKRTYCEVGVEMTVSQKETPEEKKKKRRWKKYRKRRLERIFEKWTKGE